MNTLSDGIVHMRCMRDLSRFGWDFFLYVDNPITHERFVASKPVYETYKNIAPMPSIACVQFDQMQALFDDLWGGGMRPSKRLQEKIPMDHLQDEIKWNRDVIDRLLKKAKM